MPYKSVKQMQFFHSKAGLKKIGKAEVAEWDAASEGKKLPERVKPPKPAKHKKKSRGK